jgi:hypothetical protein
MSVRFRFKIGPFVYDERLGRDKPIAPIRLRTSDLVLLAAAATALVAAVVLAFAG